MSDDLLERATRELRETGDALPADLTRARILATMRKGERRRGRLMLFLVPIAAVLVGTSALARNGSGLRRVWDDLAVRVGLVEREVGHRATQYEANESKAKAVTPMPAEAPQRAEAPPPAAEEPEVTPAPVAAKAPSLMAAPSTASAQTPTPRTAPHRSAADEPSAAEGATPATNAPPPVDDAEVTSLALYKKAYQLHFVARDYAAALVAWDAYLRSAPQGRLNVEARYNRALALVRLGRKDEARVSLTPFARGEMGGYRKREAAALLDVLTEPAR